MRIETRTDVAVASSAVAVVAAGIGALVSLEGGDLAWTAAFIVGMAAGILMLCRACGRTSSMRDAKSREVAIVERAPEDGGE